MTERWNVVVQYQLDAESKDAARELSVNLGLLDSSDTVAVVSWNITPVGHEQRTQRRRFIAEPEDFVENMSDEQRATMERNREWLDRQ